MRSCCSTIAVGHVAMGGQQESNWGGLHERACARDRPGLFCESSAFESMDGELDYIMCGSLCVT